MTAIQSGKRLAHSPLARLTMNRQIHATTMVASTSGVRRCLVDAQC